MKFASVHRVTAITKKTEDYLDSFSAFIKEQVNQSAALSAVANKPRDLTRAQLKEIRLLLDQHGFTEARLESAWRNSTNQDIAASIIGHIRRAAIGEALIPFELRVDRAMEKIFTRHSWTTSQRKWLQRLVKQLKHEVIINDTFVNQAFAEYGGAKLLDDQLDSVLDQLSQALWVS
jgi:type I restriction enzyme, R subunit